MNFLLRVVFSVFFLVTYLSVFAASSTTVDPMNLPRLSEYVTDFSGILSAENIKNLREVARAYELKTTNQMVVVLFPNRDGNELFEIGMKIFKSNQIGQKDANNGVLLLIATDEKKIRIITGYGMEGSIPDALASRWIEQDIRPRVNNGDFAGAIDSFYKNISGLSESSDEVGASAGTDGEVVPLLLVLGSVLELITIIGAWIFAKNSVKIALGTSGINVLKKVKFNAENTLLLTEKSTSWYKKSIDPANISYKDWDKNHDRLEEVFPFQKIHITSFLAAFFVAILSAFLAANLILGIVFFSIVFIPVFLVGVTWLTQRNIASFLSSDTSQKYRDGSNFIYEVDWFYNPIQPSSGNSGSGWGGGSSGGGFSGGGGSSGGGGAGD